MPRIMSGRRHIRLYSSRGHVLSRGTQTLSVTFTPNNPLYATETATVQLVGEQRALRLIWPTPMPITYGTPLTGFQLDATASSGTIQVPLDSYYNVYGIYNTGQVPTTHRWLRQRWLLLLQQYARLNPCLERHDL